MRYLSATSILIATLFALNSSGAIADISVIVNPANPLASISKSEVKKIFLGINSYFPGGKESLPVDLEEPSMIREKFYQIIANKNLANMNAYWSQMVFSGEAIPPEVIGDGNKTKSWIASNPGGIAYIDTSLVDGSVKVVLTIK